MMVAVAVSMLSLPVRVLIHELGHALAAKAVGARAITVSVGNGPERRGLRWAGIRIRLHAYPYAGGRTSHLWPAASSFRWREAAIIVAGGGANLVSGGAAILIAYVVARLGGAATPLILGGLTGFAVSSLWLAALNLAPFRAKKDADLPSDGWLLLQLLRPAPAIVESQAHLVQVYAFNRAGLYDDLARAALEAVRRPPYSAWLWSAALDALSKSKGHRSAVECYLANKDEIAASAAADADGKRTLAWIEGTVAWSILQLEDTVLLPLAGNLSQSAITEVSDAAPLIATRGAWLLATGQTAAGVAMIESAIRDLADRTDKSDFCGALARGLGAMGEDQRAGTFAALQGHLAGST